MSRWHTTEFDLLPERAFQSRGWKGSMTLEGGKGSAPGPDPRMAEAANRQIDLAEKQWDEYIKEGGDRDWMRARVEDSIAISKKTADKSAELSDYQLGAMKRNDDRYWDVAVPYEDQLLEDSKRFDTAEYKQGMVDKAIADVNIASNNAEAQRDRSLTRMGVNPNSGNYAAQKTATGNAKALGMATAANTTRQASEQIGLATKMQMYGGMKGLAGLGNASAGLATNAMGLGLNAGNSMTGAAAQSIGTNNATFGTTMSGMSSGISGLGQSTQLAQNATKINNDADPFASLLGAGATLGAAAIGKYSDRRLKTGIELVGRDARTGLNIYEFEYIGSDKRFRGVMADEVLGVKPEAVIVMPNGYKAVNYTAIGIQMTTA